MNETGQKAKPVLLDQQRRKKLTQTHAISTAKQALIWMPQSYREKTATKQHLENLENRCGQ